MANPAPRPRRPPLAEVDAAVLADAIRAGHWRVVAPWALLLAGFSLVLAGLISFLWLSATISGHPEDRWLIAPLAGGLAWWVWRRFAARPAFAAGLVLALAAITTAGAVAWGLIDAAGGHDVWLGLLSLLVLCGLGIGVGLLGLNRLGPPGDA